jgi:hypothetical protein
VLVRKFFGTTPDEEVMISATLLNLVAAHEFIPPKADISPIFRRTFLSNDCIWCCDVSIAVQSDVLAL